MARIKYRVPVPRLRGMRQEQKDKAIEDYMRESQRQLRMIFDALDNDNKTQKGTDDGETD